MEPSTTLTLFKDIKSKKGLAVNFTWSELIRAMSDFSIGIDKSQLPAFSAASFSGGKGKKNVTTLSALVVDYDDGPRLEVGVAPFKKLGVRFIAYSSFNHRRISDHNPFGSDRYRVILPLSESIPADGYLSLWKWAENISGGRIDTRCKSEHQLYFMPGVADEESDFEFLVNEGNPLDWRALDLPTTHPEEPQLTSDIEIAELPIKMPRTAEQILNGEIPVGGEYASRSEADMAVIVSLVRHGYDDEAIRELLRWGQHESRYLDLLSQSSTLAECWLSTSIEKARSLGNTREFTAAREQATAIAAAVKGRPWKGKSGTTDRDVLLAHCEIMHRCGKLLYHASVRCLADLADVSAGAVSKSHKRLIEAGFLKPS